MAAREIPNVRLIYISNNVKILINFSDTLNLLRKPVNLK